MRSRMRSHTRPSRYVSRSRKAESMSAVRPGNRSFSFTGEFPEAGDRQPVEAAGAHRQYMVKHNSGSYQAVRDDQPARMPIVNRFGMHFIPVLGVWLVFALVLGTIYCGKLNRHAMALDKVRSHESRIVELSKACDEARSQIAEQSKDVNIRKEAQRMGFVSARNAPVYYLDAPADAVITSLDDRSIIMSIAAIWGN